MIGTWTAWKFSQRLRLSNMEIDPTVQLLAEIASLEAYTYYIEDHMDDFRDGWVPVCFGEFAESEECFLYITEGRP
jgi:hypothetical protein